MKTVAEILKSKGREVWTITPETIVFDALKTMADYRNETTLEKLSCTENRQRNSRRERS